MIFRFVVKPDYNCSWLIETFQRFFTSAEQIICMSNIWSYKYPYSQLSIKFNELRHVNCLYSFQDLQIWQPIISLLCWKMLGDNFINSFLLENNLVTKKVKWTTTMVRYIYFKMLTCRICFLSHSHRYVRVNLHCNRWWLLILWLFLNFYGK